MNGSGDNDMPEKILRRLVSIIREDHLLKEFSLIPTGSTDVDRNVCPVRYVADEHCVGVESWCVKHVFKYAQAKILEYRRMHKRPYRNAADTLNVYLTGVLLIQPEVTSFWNAKRELLTADAIDADTEYRFSALLLSHRCKSYEAFTYRRWLIENTRPSNVESTRYYGDVLRRELDVLRRATEGTPNNYHAWNHRIWCFENVTLPFLPLAVQLEELVFSERWISRHVSEHTGFHYRQYVLNRFKDRVRLPDDVLTSLDVLSTDDNSNIVDSMLDSEYLDKFEENSVRLYNQYLSLLLHELFKVLPPLHVLYPGHESLWYHRRFLIAHVYLAIREIYGILDRPDVRIPVRSLPSDVNIVEDVVNVLPCRDDRFRLAALRSSYLYKLLLAKEREFLDGLSASNAWNERDSDLAARYKKWTRCVLNVNI